MGHLITPVASAVVAAAEGTWVAGLVTLVVASGVSLLVSDVRRAGGIADWRNEQMKPSKERAKLRQDRKRWKVEGRIKRRELRRGAKS
ncbi:MAG TPA: hypothetical protein VI318_24725 [Baekduia sp.]